jgi:hypothetical protein
MTSYDSRIIQNLSDVEKEFPLTFNKDILKNKTVKGFIQIELDDLVDTAHDDAIYAE